MKSRAPSRRKRDPEPKTGQWLVPGATDRNGGSSSRADRDGGRSGRRRPAPRGSKTSRAPDDLDELRDENAELAKRIKALEKDLRAQAKREGELQKRITELESDASGGRKRATAKTAAASKRGRKTTTSKTGKQAGKRGQAKASGRSSKAASARSRGRSGGRTKSST